jgi:hypothetical protein
MDLKLPGVLRNSDNDKKVMVEDARQTDKVSDPRTKAIGY